jgi:hypothetical protein
MTQPGVRSAQGLCVGDVVLSQDELRKALEDYGLSIDRQIRASLESTDFAVRAQFRKHFRTEEELVRTSTATAMTMLSIFTAWLPDDDLDRIRVVGMLNSALILELSSFKLFMFGHTVGSGSLFRQVIEGVCLAFLFSVKSLPYLQRYEANVYTSNNAVKDLRRHATIAGVSTRAMGTINDAYQFYHQFAHLSKLSVAATANFARGGIPQLGAHFDDAKLPQYGNEARSRAKFARVLPNAVLGVCRNLSLW